MRGWDCGKLICTERVLGFYRVIGLLLSWFGFVCLDCWEFIEIIVSIGRRSYRRGFVGGCFCRILVMFRFIVIAFR